MRKSIIAIFILTLFLCAACHRNKQPSETPHAQLETQNAVAEVEQSARKNSAVEILGKPEIPILCYHRITEGRNDAYSVSPATFSSHLQVLADSGYTSVLPAQLYDYLLYNHSLPEKPFMITFDDSRKEHIDIAAPELEKHGFRGAFFIMTVTYNKPNYMSTNEIAELAARGHTVGLHSWDHVMATKYAAPEDWQKQVVAPQKKLEEIIGQPVRYWAYPNGVYNHAAAEELDKHFDLSFILMSKRDSVYPLQTVRRMIVPTLSPQKLVSSMRSNFHLK